MSDQIHIGISTCPNDTFAFHALLNGRIDTGDLKFEFELLDVDELNRRLFQGDFDVAKASFHAAAMLTDELAVLSSGSALGFGVGPLLLAGNHGKLPGDEFTDVSGKQRTPRVGCPGQFTTATLLYEIFFPGQGELQQMVFSGIMPKLKTGELDFGVCIHEGRFTYRQEGLDCVADLGELWEKKTNLPLPLGGILVRKSLGSTRMKQVQSLVRQSVEFGLAHREETLPTMKKYAQEFADDVLFAHVDTYVNEWTVDLGDLGRESLNKLAELCGGGMKSTPIESLPSVSPRPEFEIVS